MTDFTTTSLHRDTPGTGAASTLVRLRALVEQYAAKPDKPLPTERELALQLGISRGSLRRGLAQLESEGLLWRRQGKGTFVGPVSTAFAPSIERLSNRTNLFEVMEVRLHIEPQLAGLAALRARGKQVAMIGRLAARTAVQSEKAKPRMLESWDSAFHRAIAEAADNRLFFELFGLVETIRDDKIWGAYRSKARTPERLLSSGREHVEIAQAIADREPARASAIMREHISSLQQALAAAIEDDLANTD